MGNDKPQGANGIQASKAERLRISEAPGPEPEVLRRSVVELGGDVCRGLDDLSQSLASVEEKPRAVQSGRRRRAPFGIWDLASLRKGL